MVHILPTTFSNTFSLIKTTVFRFKFHIVLRCSSSSCPTIPRLSTSQWPMHWSTTAQLEHISWWRHQMDTFSALLALCWPSCIMSYGITRPQWVKQNPQLSVALQWRYNERGGLSNHRRLECLLNRLFKPKSKKTSKLRVTGLVVGIHRWIPHTKGQ